MSFRALFYLEYRQLVNVIRLTLRTPKRLIPVVLMILWLLFVILMQVLVHQTGGKSHPLPMMGLVMEMAQSGLLIFTILLSLYVINRSFSESLVIYSPAEMDVLIAMPIERRLVMGLKLGSLYAKFGFYLALMGMFVGMQSVESVGYAPVLALVAWLALVLYSIVIINISTVINLIVAHAGAEKRWQRTLVLGLTLGLVLLVGVTFYAAYGRTGDAMAAFAALIRQPVLVTLAAPAVWASGMALSMLQGWQPAFAWQMPVLALLALVTTLMVLSRRENPYEPSLAISARKALIRMAVKSGDLGKVRAQMMSNRVKSAATLIAPFGRGATAILWKNMLVSARVSRSALIAVTIIVPTVALIGRATIKDKGLLEFAPEVMTGIALYMSWVLAMLMQQMLRGDLKQVNILKPMPISPWWLMVAETANAGLMVWGFIWLLFGSAVFLLGAPASDLMIVSGLALPFVAYASICSQTTVAVLYPNWGDMSQQWIANLMSMLLTVLSVGPPVAVGAIMWALHVPPAIMASAVIATSLALAAGGITLGAATYRSHDPTDE